MFLSAAMIKSLQFNQHTCFAATENSAAYVDFGRAQKHSGRPNCRLQASSFHVGELTASAYVESSSSRFKEVLVSLSYIVLQIKS